MTEATPPYELQIQRWLDTAEPQRLAGAIDAIFFDSAATQSFAGAAARAAFRARWLGRFLEHDAEHVWLALAPSGEVAGYLVGCLDDPARTARFSDIGYFATFAGLTRHYPAHLHINLAARWRGAGAGSRLVAAFTADAARRGAPGVHAVTGQGMRNVGFYTRNGFAAVGHTQWHGRDIVMLGRRL